MKGVVVKFFDERGFGFIRTKTLPEDAFVRAPYRALTEVHPY
jgi:cold shock CspA family protein